MYGGPAAWSELMKKLVGVTAEYSAEQVRAGADTIQIFDSWVGCLSVEDYRRYVLPHAAGLVKRLQRTGAPNLLFRHATPQPRRPLRRSQPRRARLPGPA